MREVSEPPPPPWDQNATGGGWGQPPSSGGWGSHPSSWDVQAAPAAPATPDMWAHHDHDGWESQPGGWDATQSQQPQMWAAPPSPTWHAYDQPPVTYAGFWRRFWGLHADGVVIQLCTAVANLVIYLGALAFAPSLRTCERFRSGGFVFERCTVPEGLLIGLMAGNILVNLIIWYRVIPRPIGRDGHTWGMRQLGLTLLDADHNSILGAGVAVWRAILAGVFQVVPAGAATIVLFYADRDGDLEPSLVVTWLVVVVSLWLLPVGWSLFDRRRQTLYDKAVGSVVLTTSEVNWFAVTAWAFTFVLPLFPLGIGFGHAAQSRARRNHRLSGSGLASVALFFSYLQLVAAVVIVVLAYAVGDS